MPEPPIVAASDGMRRRYICTRKKLEEAKGHIYVKFMYAQGLCHWITFPPGFRLFYRKEEETDEKRKQFPTQEISQRAIDQERTDFRQKLGTKIRKISKYNPPENNRNICKAFFDNTRRFTHNIYIAVCIPGVPI